MRLLVRGPHYYCAVKSPERAGNFQMVRLTGICSTLKIQKFMEMLYGPVRLAGHSYSFRTLYIVESNHAIGKPVTGTGLLQQQQQRQQQQPHSIRRTPLADHVRVNMNDPLSRDNLPMVCCHHAQVKHA